MERYDAWTETSDAVEVQKSELPGRDDPRWEAVQRAKRMSWPSGEPADHYEYEAVDRGDYYTVVRTRLYRRSARSKREAISGPGYEVREWRGVDVAEVLEQKLTVADLRELGRRHDVSYSRGSRKAELVEQFVDQAPDVAFELAGQRHPGP